MTTSRRRLLAPLMLLPLLAATALPAAAWGERVTGSGRSATETRSITGFDSVSLSGGMDLLVRQASGESVQVQADDNLLPLLETELDGSTLKVRWKRGTSIDSRSKVLVTVNAVKLRAVSAAGSGDIQVEPFTTPALQLALSGSGNATLKGLSTDELGVRISGSGDVRGDGKAGRISISIAGSGDVALTELRADAVQVRIAGSGDAQVNAQKTLEVSIAGSGDVRYVGEASVSSSIAGSGSVKKK
jgi:hypothetical protein